MIRYIAHFKDNSQFSLYGDDYFNDKAIFNRHHHSNLVDFSKNVAAKNRPYKVSDQYKNIEILFNNDAEFDEWYKINQCSEPDFGFKTIESKNDIIESKEIIIQEAFEKIDRMIDFIKLEIENLTIERQFNHWRIDGGYKVLDTITKTSIESINRIKEINILPLNLVEKLDLIFRIPSTTHSHKTDLISYSRKSLEIDTNLLLKLLRENLELINSNKNDLIKMTKNDNFGLWWQFWK